jgi:hypothetical protein
MLFGWINFTGYCDHFVFIEIPHGEELKEVKMSKAESIKYLCGLSPRCKSETCSHAKLHTPSECVRSAPCGQWPNKQGFQPIVRCVPVSDVVPLQDCPNCGQAEAAGHHFSDCIATLCGQVKQLKAENKMKLEDIVKNNTPKFFELPSDLKDLSNEKIKEDEVGALQTEIKVIKQLCDIYDEVGTLTDEAKLPPLAERVFSIMSEIKSESMEELITVLQEIQSEHEGGLLCFPQFIKQTDLEVLNNEDVGKYDKQKSDLSFCDFEYVNQTCGACCDDYRGYMLYPYKDIFIKVYYEC